MSVEQLQQEIRQLSASELADLTRWLCDFLGASPIETPLNWEESTEQLKELQQRLTEFTTNPTIAEPFEADYFANLKQQLADETAKKA